MTRTLRERALAMLARREHTRAELARKLAGHAETGEALEALLDDLAARRLLSDARFAGSFVSQRGARFGDARLAHELRRRGVPADVATAAMAEVEGNEIERARAVWLKKFDGVPEDRAAWMKQARFLQQRGFSAATIRRILGGREEEA